MTFNQGVRDSNSRGRTKITALLRLFMRSDAVIFVLSETLTTF